MPQIAGGVNPSPTCCHCTATVVYIRLAACSRNAEGQRMGNHGQQFLLFFFQKHFWQILGVLHTTVGLELQTADNDDRNQYIGFWCVLDYWVDFYYNCLTDDLSCKLLTSTIGFCCRK